MTTGREKFKKNKKILFVLVGIVSILPRWLRVYLWDYFSRYSQILFIGIRYILLKSLVKQCGDNVKVGTNVQILGWSKLILGSNVSIHSNSYIDANGGIIIGDNVSIAHNSTIISTNHSWIDENIPIKYNNLKYQSVFISNDVWIGCGSRILAGVNIPSRCVVAAGAVVNKDLSSRTIVGGIPARRIKEI